jgi:membrane protease YdiL (CAAX protease family)
VNERQQNEPKPDRFDLLLRVGGFAVVAYVVLVIVSGALARLDPVVRSAFAVFAAGFAANFLASSRFARGSFADFGLGWQAGSARQFVAGVGIGLGAVTVLVGGAVLAGLARFEQSQPDRTVAWLSIVLLAGVIGEELVFRGYAFQYLLRNFGKRRVIIGSAVLFGLVHLSNPNVQPLGVVNTMLWGALLGFAYTRAETLWLSSGLHFGWNLALALLTSNMSGITIRATAWDLRWSADDLWSGGGYGIEGGLLAAIVALPVFLLLRRVR